MKTQKKPMTKERVVYEVRGLHGVNQVDAASTADLKKAIAHLLDLEPYSLQAAAHLAHHEKALVTGQGWSIRRLGVLAFVPDAPEQARRSGKASEAEPATLQTPIPTVAPEVPEVSPVQLFNQTVNE